MTTERLLEGVAGEASEVAPDLATCDACIEEILDPASRRHGYAFTSCGACGPRLTIMIAAPYDRSHTTMAGFPICARCRAEYEAPADRRFHDQSIACADCGPRLVMPGEDGEPIDAAVALLRAGGIIAIKGLGGYHLACDATNEEAVAELRRRKEHDAKPLAVMVRDIAVAEALAVIDDDSRALLVSPARPNVLVPRRSSAELAPSVAPGVADVELVLPYTPLHHLLLRAVSLPLVMTIGSLGDEPVAYEDDDAKTRLGTVADRFLTHDRAIHVRCDDSVVRAVDGAPMILRRARGYAPVSLRCSIPVARPTLALGGHMKASFVYGVGNVAFASPHLGDLDDLTAYEAFVAASITSASCIG